MSSSSRPLYRQARLAIVQFFLLAAAPFQAQAARPFVTDDARIVDPGGYQIETYYKRQRAFRENEFWFLPAHNPGGRVELTLGGFRVDSEPQGNSRALIAQAKTLLRPLETNGSGYALTVGLMRLSRDAPGSVENNPYINGIGSLSFSDDAVVMHANLGARRDAEAGLTRGTWGLGAEIRLHERLFGIVETYGERGEKPTKHLGLRVWIVPSRVQVDSTLGFERTDPERRFYTVGLRVLW
jgi:hypothetical protein